MTLATEGPVRPGRHASGHSAPGAVALVGPSRSGKTSAAISGILQWRGPAVLSSVKADLLGATETWRASQGEVRVFDPTRTIDGRPTAKWSPVRQADTILGAQRAARALCDAAPNGGVEGLDFWLAQTEILLSGLLYVAHHTGQDMGDVCDWVLRQDRPSEDAGDVRRGLNGLVTHRDRRIRAAALEVQKALQSVWSLEDRTRSSIFSTAQTVVWPWSDPGVAASARRGKGGDHVSLDWLLAGANTVYLCAPIEDQRRLSPAFGGLINDLINQAYRHTARTGRPIDPPLLVVIDEAGNTPLRALPEYASTLAGIGVVLVTIWQSLAQVDSAYGKQSDTILTNHRTKCFYAGLSDPASLRYVADVLGTAEVGSRSRSTARHGGSRSEQLSTTQLPLAPPHVLRQMRPGDALLLHGTLPPAHIRTVPYFRNRKLRARAAGAPHIVPTVTDRN